MATEICKAYVDEFEHTLTRCSKFEIKGIMHSEMLLFCSLLKHLNCDLIIESGRGRGQSTEVIARWMQVPFYSIEKREIRNEDDFIALKRITGLGVRCLNGTGQERIPELMAEYRKDNKRVAILIDGPKGKRAYRMARRFKKYYPNIVLIAIHDMHQDANKIIRRMSLEDFPHQFASDDEGYVKEFSYLDEPCWKVRKDEHDPITLTRKDGRRGWIKPYYQGDTRTTSYGPTILCFMRDEL